MKINISELPDKSTPKAIFLQRNTTKDSVNVVMVDLATVEVPVL